MGTNYISKFRKSYFGQLVLSALMSNLMIFGQPLQQLLGQHMIARKYHYASAATAAGSRETPSDGTAIEEAAHKTTPADAASGISYAAAETAGISGRRQMPTLKIRQTIFSG